MFFMLIGFQDFEVLKITYGHECFNRIDTISTLTGLTGLTGLNGLIIKYELRWHMI